MLIFRHPPVIAPHGLCYGQLDLAAGAAPLEEWLRRASGKPALERVYSSPASRCANGARELAERLALPLLIDDRLQELDFGKWDGLLWDQVPRAQLDAWSADFASYAPGGGENLKQFFARVDAWHATVAAPQGALVVTHQGVIAALAWRALGHARLPTSAEWPPLRVQPGEALDLCAPS